MQIIFHIDIDAFFASAEVSVDPSLANKPLVIAGNSRRGIITTASYEARKYGIHSAMPLFQAQKLCKDLVNRPVNMPLYKKKSSSFFSIIASYSEVLQVASIDECYVDVTNYIMEKNIAPEVLAQLIQQEVLRKEGITISIGIAPNKFLAKMASDMQKPNGVTTLTRLNFKEKLWPLPIKSMFGIGKKTQPKLIENGITTIGDIANPVNYDLLRSILGKNALLVYRRANGIDQSKVHVESNQLKSVGNSTTLQYDTTDIDELYDLLSKLATQVSKRAINRDLLSNTVAITIKYTRFESVSRQVILPNYINDYETVLSTAKRLLDEHYDNRPVRLLGITMQNVIEKKDYKHQVSLFDIEKKSIETTESKVFNDLQRKFGNKVIKASQLKSSSIQKKYLDNDE